MGKDIKLSNMKGLLIFSVVFGHILAQYQSDFNGLYLTIYSFHMPLFILLSGYFAKHVTVKKGLNIIVIYFVFQLLYRSFQFLLHQGDNFKLVLGVPYYHLWYLVSLGSWYLLAVFVRKLSLKRYHKIGLLLVFFGIGILARVYTEPIIHLFAIFHDKRYDEHAFSYLRTLVYLPFFFIGFFLSREHMYRIYTSLKKCRWLPACGVIVVFLFFTLSDIANIEGILKGAKGVNGMSGSLPFITFKMTGCYIIALIMCYLLLNLMHEKKCLLTKWGERTMPIFLFHAFITKLMVKYHLFQGFDKWQTFILLVATALITIIILSSDLFMSFTYYLWHPFEIIENIRRKFKTGLQPLIK